MAGEFEIDFVDYTSIDFPSDKLSVRDLRRAHPDQFDVEGEPRFFQPDGLAEEVVGGMIGHERILARGAYEAVRGDPNYLVNEYDVDRDTFIDELTAMYTPYGLASGPEAARLLIERFEAQAAGQAAGPQAGRHGRGGKP